MVSATIRGGGSRWRGTVRAPLGCGPRLVSCPACSAPTIHQSQVLGSSFLAAPRAPLPTPGGGGSGCPVTSLCLPCLRTCVCQGGRAGTHSHSGFPSHPCLPLCPPNCALHAKTSITLPAKNSRSAVGRGLISLDRTAHGFLCHDQQQCWKFSTSISPLLCLSLLGIGNMV